MSADHGTAPFVLHAVDQSSDDGPIQSSPAQNTTNEQPRDSGDEHILIPFHTTLFQEQHEASQLSLSRKVFDTLSLSEQATLPRLFQKFFTSAAFRSTMTYNLDPRNQAPTGIGRLTSLSGDVDEDEDTFDLLLQNLASSQTATRFPFMQLPTELRIMIAEFAFYTAEGLCWTWQNYRKGPKVAKLRHGPQYDREPIETLNALSRTCKSLYAETHTIVFKVNTLVFDCKDMHCARTPRKWFNQTYTPSGALDTVAEGLLFFGRNVPSNVQPLFPAARLDLQRIPRFEDEITHFKDFMHNFRGFQLHIRYTAWALEPLPSWFLEDMQESEEDGVPFVSKHDEMRKRFNDYVKKAHGVNDLVIAVSDENPGWRIYPNPVGDQDMAVVCEYLTDEEKRLVLAWQRLGI